MRDADPVRLRPVNSGDLTDCVRLLAQLGYTITAKELERRVHAVSTIPDHLLLAAEIDGQIVGLMHAFARPAIENPREAVVQSVVVDEEYRRTGVGRKLLAAAEQWGRERDCDSVTLSSNIVRAPAHAFYSALGYGISATAHVFRKSLLPQ